MTFNDLLLYTACFMAGMTFDNWVCGQVLRPWARRRLGRPLEQDLWGLEDK